MPIEYVAKRALQLLLIVFVAVTINFLIPRLIPGDPVESALQTKMAMTGNVNVDVQAVAAAYRAKFGLDKPLWLQYVNYWGSLLNRDLGVWRFLNRWPRLLYGADVMLLGLGLGRDPAVSKLLVGRRG